MPRGVTCCPWSTRAMLTERHRLGGPEQRRFLSLLEAGKSKIKAPADWVSERPASWLTGMVLTWWEG